MRIIIIALPLALAACAAPQTTMQHPETKQVLTCQASQGSAVIGGYIGAKASHDQCVKDHEALGFVAVERPPEEQPTR